MTYDSPIIANNILSRSFTEHIYINYQQLNKMLFLSACEYAKIMPHPMLAENFSTFAFGPISYSVKTHFDCCGTKPHSKPIKFYARNCKNKTHVIDEDTDVELYLALEYVWQKTKHMPVKELIEITRLPDSAWDKAYQADKPYIDHEDMRADTTYYEALGLNRSLSDSAAIW